MFGIHASPLPEGAFLHTYANRPDCYTDCYVTDVVGAVSQSQFITAFYTTWLFRCEKWILDHTIKRPSDAQVLADLAAGVGQGFAAWSVEARDDTQLLLCDFSARTRSWLMVRPIETGTRLFFGSAVVPATQGAGLGLGVTSLLGFHKAYSVALLRCASARLEKRIQNQEDNA